MGRKMQFLISISGLATLRQPVLEVTATIEPLKNGRGFSLRVLQAGSAGG